MAIADKAGLITVEKVNSETLPEAAKIISDTLTQAAVILNGALNGVEGERILAMQGLKDDVIAPLLEELSKWRGEFFRLNNTLEKLTSDGLYLGTRKQ